MPVRGFAVAKVLGDARQSAMRVCQRAVKSERGFELQPRSVEVTVFIEKAAQIDPSGSIQRPMADQLLIGGARGGTVAAAIGEAPQPMQCCQIGRQSLQQREIGAKRFVVFAFGRKAPRLVEKRLRVSDRLTFGQGREARRLGMWHDGPTRELVPD